MAGITDAYIEYLDSRGTVSQSILSLCNNIAIDSGKWDMLVYQTKIVFIYVLSYSALTGSVINQAYDINLTGPTVTVLYGSNYEIKSITVKQLETIQAVLNNKTFKTADDLQSVYELDNTTATTEVTSLLAQFFTENNY